MPSRRSIRLPHYDYTSVGGYFITICTKDKKCVFGRVDGEQMCLNPIGRVAHDCWLQIPEHFSNVILDAYVIMPNHMHGILMLSDPNDESKAQRSRNVVAQYIALVVSAARAADDEPTVGTQNFAPVGTAAPAADDELTVGAQNFAPVVVARSATRNIRECRVQPKSVGSIIRVYKAAVTRECRFLAAGSGDSIWQRNYHEHIIRNEQDLREIREYIVYNPLKWALDRYYTE